MENQSQEQYIKRTELEATRSSLQSKYTPVLSIFQIYLLWSCAPARRRWKKTTYFYLLIRSIHLSAVIACRTLRYE